MKANEGRETAISSGDYPLFADDIGKSLKALRDKIGMLDSIGLGIDHTDNQRLIVR
jgi:hypothetical protein